VNTSLEHLPPKKRDQLVAIAKVIAQRARVEMVVLFGSHARGDWVEDRKTGYLSDFDLLVLVDSPALVEDKPFWNDVRAQLRPYAEKTPVSLFVHDIRQVNEEIRHGQYFFSDIAIEGILLHTSKRFELATPKAVKAGGRLNLALSNYDLWFGSACHFWRGAVGYATQGLDCHAAFLFHQAAERYLHCALLVFTGYKPKSHDLEALARKAAEVHPRLVDALPRTQPTDLHHFDLLKRAYIESRYSRSYHVNAVELTAMRDMVIELGRRVRQACAEEIERIAEGNPFPELFDVPNDQSTLEAPPEPPDLNDPAAVGLWRDGLIRQSFEAGEQRGLERGLEKGREEGIQIGVERGREQGREEGREEGVQIGVERGREEGRLEERARSIVDVLRFRGLSLTEAQEQRVLQCRDEITLARWRANMFTISSVDELEG
jgi:predicted nucleotidyltransferase/HEPN domain-containing protein